MVWCGWVVDPFDILLSDAHDLSDPVLQQELAATAPDDEATVMAPACQTLSQAREIPMPGGAGGPPILRSGAFPLGLPDLQGPDAHRVATANNFCAASCRLG